ncbi:MAG: AAA family ATPase, partial [Gemmatimonadetes bacterium]|nr:AAA family ATPase [Gemmatimonadota bacterium]
AKLHLDATIEDLNFKAPRGLDRSLILRLASGQWIRDGQTVLVSGAPDSVTYCTTFLCACGADS